MTANNPISHQRSAVPRQRLRLRDIIRRRLVECGWCMQVQILCEEVIKENEGRNVSFDSLLKQIFPHAREMVPPSFRENLYEELRTTELAEDYEDEEEVIICGVFSVGEPSNASNQTENTSTQTENASNQQENS